MLKTAKCLDEKHQNIRLPLLPLKLLSQKEIAPRHLKKHRRGKEKSIMGDFALKNKLH